MNTIMSLLSAAQLSQDFSEVIAFIQANRSNLAELNTTENGNPVAFACEHRLEEVLTALMEVPGIDVNYPNPTNDMRPLHRAIALGWETGVRLLLRARTTLDLSTSLRSFDGRSYTPIQYAQMLNATNICHILEAAIESIDLPHRLAQETSQTRQSTSQTSSSLTLEPLPRVKPAAFLAAADRGDLAMVTRYLSELAPNDIPALNYRDINTTGNTALIAAAANGHMAIVQALTQCKRAPVDLLAKNFNDDNAAQVAKNYGHTEIADLITQLAIDEIKKLKIVKRSSQAISAETLSYADRIKKTGRAHLVPEILIDPVTAEICNDPLDIHGKPIDRSTVINLFVNEPYASLLPHPLTRKPIHRCEIERETSQYWLSEIDACVLYQEWMAERNHSQTQSSAAPIIGLFGASQTRISIPPNNPNDQFAPS